MYWYIVHFVILASALQNTDCYNPNRQSRVSIADNVQIDSFPEVEYPTSITDTANLFYLNVSPFSTDVQSSFKSFAPKDNSKSTPTIILNVKTGDKAKETHKNNNHTSEKVISNQPIQKPGKDINSNDTQISEISLGNSSMEYWEDQTDRQVMDGEATDRSAEKEHSDYEEIKYIIGFTDGLDDIIPTIIDIDTESIDSTNSTVLIFDNEHPNEIVAIPSAVNNTVVELIELSSHMNTSLIEALPNNSTVTNG